MRNVDKQAWFPLPKRRGHPPVSGMRTGMTPPLRQDVTPAPALKPTNWVVYLVLALIVLAGVLPFADRAFYMDEHIFLLLARSARSNWMFPADTPVLFFGTRHADFASHTHPPVGEYFLAGIDWLMPEFNEAPYRMLFAVFPIMAALGFYSVARRFARAPLMLTLLLIASPAFFVMSHTVMMDVPMLAFLLVGLALFLSHIDGSRGRLIPASVCFILAAGIGYTALVPLGCLFLWALYRRRPWVELAAIAAAPTALAIWLGAMTVHFGRFPLADTVSFYLNQPRSTYGNVLATFSFLGGVGLFPWAFASIVDIGRKALWTVAAGAIGIASILTVPLTWSSANYRLWFIVLASAGLATLGVAFVGVFQRRARLPAHHSLVALWVPAVLIFFVIVGDMINARYILLALPALYLLMFSGARAGRIAPAAAVTWILSVGIATADYRFANGYRDWVDHTLTPLQQQGFRVWGAAESGLRFYLEQQGVDSLAATDLDPVGGDLIVQHNMFRYSLAEKLTVLLIRLNRYELTDWFPVRTFNTQAGAGFHDSRFGLVPYTWSRVPFDYVEVSQLSPLVGSLSGTDKGPHPQPVWSPEGPILVQREEIERFPFRSPPNAELRYELEGNGLAVLGDGFIELRQLGSSTVIWRNLRVVPPSLP